CTPPLATSWVGRRRGAILGRLEKIARPPPPARRHPGNRKQPFDFMAITGVDAKYVSGNCLAPLSPVFPRKSAVSSSTRGRFWAYEAVNPRFSPEKQGLDALINYVVRRVRSGASDELDGYPHS